MKKKRNFDEFKHLLMFITSLILVAGLTLIFAYVWFKLYNPYIMTLRGSWLLIGLYAFEHILFAKIYGAFKVGYYKSGDIIYSQTLTMLIVNLLMYFQICLIARVVAGFVPIIEMTLYDFVAIVIWVFISSKIYAKLYPPKRLIIVYSSHNAEELVRKMSQRTDKYQICEAINCEEGFEAIKARIDNYDGAIICDLPGKDRNDILKYCFEHGKRTYVTPKLSDIIIRGAENIHLFDTPILLSRNNGLTFEQRVLKRFLDIFLSVIGLIIISPFMLIVSFLIKIYDGGPVFFKQDRVTKDGRVFKIYKFRSMREQTPDEKAHPAEKDDDRITPIGKIIRKIRFDEFPQLINIIKGDMSIVGPRPEAVELFDKYEESIPEFKYRTKVKAGLTGYAQIFGKYNTSAYDKLKLDLIYIEDYSLRLDVQLVIMTIKVLFMKESTEGFDNDIGTPDAK
jgi:exopolysaccharide biosynthesis polyprenyl glycosylphosphotransferase